MTREIACPRCGAALNGADACPACGYQTAREPDTTETFTALAAGDKPGSSGPSRIGPYKILGTLGEGGMGVVYLADQTEPIQRRVALKLIKLGMDTRQVVARFQAERQALALMDHPNIASVFDADATTDGRPYFVMEYIAGVRITEYCNTQRLSTRERLRLFIQVCAAMQHAHQKGVIHRDVKPSNVLVMVKDGQPVPKIIDFGLAKAIHLRLTEETLFTEHGLMVGTPEYMSPEQAEKSGLDVDATTDIYSLGVLLYELLVGALPFERARLRGAGYAEIQRIIREEDPPTPSERLSGLGATASEVARQRQTDRTTLERELRGDLDWITLRALEKDRTRRYLSASELAADLTRHLNDEPVVARPVSAVYRVGKFVRRHRIGVLSGVGGVAALIAALFVTTAMYIRAEGARQRADYQAYVATLAAADAHLKAGEYLRAERRLLASGPEFRDTWEWRHLHAVTDTSVATAFLREDPAASADLCRRKLSVAPDGRHVLYAGGHVVQAWDVERATVSTLFSTEHVILTIDPGGKLAVIGIGDGSTTPGNFGRLEVMDLSSGTKVSDLAHPGAFAAAFDASGAKVATASINSVIVWNSQGGTQVGDPIGVAISRPELVNFKVAPDGSSVVQNPNIWQAASRQQIALGVDADFPACAVFSPDAQRLVTTSVGGLQEWDVPTGRLLRKLGEGVIGPSPLAFSPDARLLAAARRSDAAVQLLEMTSEQIVATLLTTDSRPPSDVAFSSDGRRLFAVFDSDRPHIRMWDIAMLHATVGFPVRARIAAINPFDVPLYSTAMRSISADGRQIAFQRYAHVDVWDVASQALSRQVALNQVRSLALSGDAGRLLAATPDGLFFSDLDGRPPTLLDRGVVTVLTISDDGGLAVAGRSSGGAGVWSLPSGTAQRMIESPNPATALRVDAARMQLVMATRSRSLQDGVELWDLRNGKQVWRTDVPRVEALAFSAECGKVAIGSTGADPNLLLLDAATGMRTLTLPGGESRVRSVAFTPDCRRLAQATDSAITLWDTSTGIDLLTLRTPAAESGRARTPQKIQFSQDGRRLLVLDSDWIRTYFSDSAYPPGVSQLVDRLFKELLFAEDVVARLRSDRALEMPERVAAVELAQQYGDSPVWLRRESQRITQIPDQSLESYTRARRMAEVCVRLDPRTSASYLSLGMALYRTGDYVAAADALGRAVRLVGRSALMKGAFLALTQARLGRPDAARAELESLRSELAKKGLSPINLKMLPPPIIPMLPDSYPEVTALVNEAEALLAGKDRR